eukprot:scaffold26560_cov36-Tisochrysis_lutea.AAC.2
MPCHPNARTASFLSAAEADEDEDETLFSLFTAVDEIDDDDIEDLYFLFEASGLPKPWAVPPHLRTVIENVASWKAKLLDIRSDAAWKRAGLSIATHYALEELLAELQRDVIVGDADLDTRRLSQWSRQQLIYVYSNASDKDSVAEAVEALRAAGFVGAVGLREGFEALRAIIPRSTTT